MKKIITQISALLLSMGIMASAAQAEDLSVSGDIGVVSQYVWRGVPQTSSKAAVQGDLGVALGGLSASVWFSNAYASPNPQFAGHDVVEFDWTVDYSGDIGETGLGYSVGAIGYTYLYDSSSNFPEIYGGLSYGPVSLTAYYNISDSANKAYLSGDLWIDLGASASVAGFDLSGTLSYANWKNDTVNRPVASSFKDGFNLVTVGVSKDLAVSDVTVTPSLTVTVPVIGKDAANNRNIYGVAATEEFVAGVNFSY
ncbi:MAG TPA: TorF family putative porin [Hyphomicrobiales bacterium]|nr:TorF family putative porin [Hyphomicrobiales bacterium]